MHPLNDNPWVKKLQALHERLQSGAITQDQFDRQERLLHLELQQAAQKEREKIMAWAIETGRVRDAAQYRSLCAHYHDEYGDSFHHYLTSIHADAVFVTLNDKILDDAPFLHLKYGGKILTPEQAVALSEQEEAQEQEATKAERKRKRPKKKSLEVNEN